VPAAGFRCGLLPFRFPEMPCPFMPRHVILTARKYLFAGSGTFFQKIRRANLEKNTADFSVKHKM
jgi:hypothetical protein